MLIFETVLIQSFNCFWACLFSKILESCLFSKRCLLSREYGRSLKIVSAIYQLPHSEAIVCVLIKEIVVLYVLYL